MGIKTVHLRCFQQAHDEDVQLCDAVELRQTLHMKPGMFSVFVPGDLISPDASAAGGNSYAKW